MTVRRVLCLACCVVDAVYKERCEKLKLRKNDCRDIVDAVCKYYWNLCKNCSAYIQCKGDVVVADINQHKSQFKNSNFTITQ